MSVRHINARPGEYIAVHRNGGGRSPNRRSSSGGDSGLGCGLLLLIIVIWCYWEVILTWTIILGTLALFATLIWKGRYIIWNCLCFCAKALWQGSCFACTKSMAWLSTAYMAWQKWRGNKHSSPKQLSLASTAQRPANYGRIIQPKDKPS